MGQITNSTSRYSKQEGEDVDYQQFTHLLSPKRDIDGFDVIHEEKAFYKLNLNWREWPRSSIIETTPQVYVLKRKGLPPPVSPSVLASAAAEKEEEKEEKEEESKEVGGEDEWQDIEANKKVEV
jgi:hypothetical protein